MTSITLEATQAARREAARRRALEELLRARPHLAGCTRARSSRIVEWIEEALRRTGRGASTRTSPRSRPGYNFGETAELFDHPYEIQPAQLRAGHVPQHHRQRRARRTGSSPPRSRRSCRSSTRRTRSRRRPTSCTSCRSYKNFGVRTLQAEDEIAAAGVAIGAAFAGQPRRSPRTSGPGRRPQVGGDRARGQPRAAADHRRRAARRAVDRPAHQDRAGRPAARDVRPPRRGAAADRRRAVAEPLLRRRVRGGAHRGRSTARR